MLRLSEFSQNHHPSGVIMLAKLFDVESQKEIKMSRKAISLYSLKEVVADLGQVFTTKDVSEDIRMKQAHLNLVDHRNYHAFVGGALSDHRAKLEIDEIKKNTGRGSHWKKL